MEGEHSEFLKTHVTGVLSHGHNLAWAIIDLLRWPADANPTTNVLLIVLKDIVKQVCDNLVTPPQLIVGYYESRVNVDYTPKCSYSILQFGRLPPVLYWQMDNCFRDCKNIYILGFCAFLVMAGIFKKVTG